MIQWVFLKSLNRVINLHWVSVIALNKSDERITLSTGDGELIEVKDKDDQLKLAEAISPDFLHEVRSCHEL